MAEPSLRDSFRTLQRVVLGVLIAFLGMTGYGVATDAFAEAQYLIALAAAVGSLVAVALVLALFVEGWREGRPA